MDRQTHTEGLRTVLVSGCAVCLVLVSIATGAAHFELPSRNIAVYELSNQKAQELQELYDTAHASGLHMEQWSVVWKGTLDRSTAQSFHPSVIMFEADDWHKHDRYERNHNGRTIQHDEWVADDIHGKHHFHLMQDDASEWMRFVYTWNGKHNPKGSLDIYASIEHTWNEFSESPLERFVSVYAREDGAWTKDATIDWMERHFRIEPLHAIADETYISAVGRVEHWHTVLDNDTFKSNLQLSARYNELDDETHVTIGYPLILFEH